jgi:branched-chain amino acid transport system ATP-binding protein
MKLAAFALAFAAAIAFTAVANSYYVFIMATLALTAVAGIGLNVLLGLTGQVSFGHVGFYALGAYAVAVLTVAAHWNFWPALLIAALLAGVMGALLALPALRVRGPYLAMVTIAFGFVVQNVAVEWRSVTGGQNGIMGVSQPALGALALGERGVAIASLLLAALATYVFHRL